MMLDIQFNWFICSSWVTNYPLNKYIRVSQSLKISVIFFSSLKKQMRESRHLLRCLELILKVYSVRSVVTSTQTNLNKSVRKDGEGMTARSNYWWGPS